MPGEVRGRTHEELSQLCHLGPRQGDVGDQVALCSPCMSEAVFFGVHMLSNCLYSRFLRRQRTRAGDSLDQEVQ